jgi:hypothetical protein
VTSAPLLLAGAVSRQLEREAYAEAARLLCRSAPHPLQEAEKCHDCRRVGEGEHPDLLVAAPESDRHVHAPPYEGHSGGKETTIPTALIRAIVAEAARRPYEGTCRVILLLDVDRTEGAAFSALLKVLEEPPTATCFILTATRPRLLPETILSRVVVRTLREASRRETAGALQRLGMSAEEAAARAAFVPGDSEAAAALDLEEARTERDGLLEAVSGLLLDGSPAWGLILANRLPADDAAGTAARLRLLARLFRDAAVAAIDPAGEAVVHRERFDDLERLGQKSGFDLLHLAERALDLASVLPESRRNPKLAAEAFALSLVTVDRTAAGGGGR